MLWYFFCCFQVSLRPSMPSRKFQQRKLVSEKSPSAAATIKDTAPQASSKTSWSRDNSSDEEDASRKTAQIGEVCLCLCVISVGRLCVRVREKERDLWPRKIGFNFVARLLVQEWPHLHRWLPQEEGSCWVHHILASTGLRFSLCQWLLPTLWSVFSHKIAVNCAS